ncbi:lytic transglycosylase domain-containing protein [Segetibacter sp. 3557_3]|uniref:lytic transglycosylase domain-containing protein n=1 Tax=Segetibacter sp. 3557_3 TaxID=2547429 RepID=UPI0014049EDC|nr:lytic transglycosylase domain-containing protein [Segetibacter sp. 3557_3]
MKNVKIITKLRRLKKTLALSTFFLGFGFAANAFKTNSSNSDGDKKPTKDSVETDKLGFKSLFSGSIFDPSRPYVTQLNPLAAPFVQKYIQTHTAHIERLKIWGKPYLDLYDGILSTYGIPKELKYLSIIESNLKAGLISVAGAAGPWQIMSAEARRVGLTVSKRTDERKNYAKSTHAAAKILKELYTRFGDWLLVIAAYNAGSGRVGQAIKKSGSKNFWVLQKYLPLETRNHVKKFIGTHYIFEGNGGITTLTASETAALQASIENQKPVKTSLENETGIESADITGRYNSMILVKNIGMELSKFNKLNPDFDKWVASGNMYKLKLPADKMKIFHIKKGEILSETVELLMGNPIRLITP